MFTALSNGLSGMLANQQALDVSAGRIAGIGATTQVASASGGAAASPSSKVTLSPAAVDYSTEAVNSIVAKNGFEMSADSVKTADQMLGTPGLRHSKVILIEGRGRPGGCCHPIRPISASGAGWF